MKKLFNFRPIFFALIILILGIFSAYSFFISNIALSIVCILSTIILLFIYGFFKFKNGFNVLTTIFILILVVIYTLSFVFFTVKVDNFSKENLNSSTLNVMGKVCEETKTNTTQVVIIKDVKISGAKNLSSNYKIIMYITDGNFEIGDIISFKGKLYDYTAIYEGKLSATYIESGIKHSISINSNEITKNGNSKNLFEGFKVFLKNTLKSGLDKDEFAVAYAMLLGNSDYMDEEVLSSFRAMGVAHIFAVSGLHIGFIMAVVYFILSKLRVNRYVSAVILILSIFFYCGVCNFTASSLRASIMISVFIFTKLLGYKNDNITSISLAGIIILLISPLQLFCVGFLLSFAVVFGLIIFTPLLKHLFKKLNKKVSSSLSSVISAQIFSFPILINTFNKTSYIAFLFNLIFIPLASVLFILTFVLTIIGGIFNIASIMLFVPNYLLKGVLFLTNLMDYKIFLIGSFTFGFTIIFYYLTLIFMTGIINLKVNIKRIICIILASVTVVSAVSYNVYLSSFDSLYVTGSERISATLIEGGGNTLIVSDFTENFSMSRIIRSVNKSKSKDIENLIIETNNHGRNSVNLITRIYSYYKIKNVYLCSKEESEISVLKNSFKMTQFYNLKEREIIEKGRSKFYFIVGGYSVIVNNNGQNMLFTSYFGKKPRYSEIDKLNYSLICAVDYLDEIASLYKSKKVVSYLRSNVFTDAETQGNFIYQIN